MRDEVCTVQLCEVIWRFSTVNSRFETEPERLLLYVVFRKFLDDWYYFALKPIFLTNLLLELSWATSRVFTSTSWHNRYEGQCLQLASAFHSAFLFFFWSLYLIPNTWIQINFLAEGISQCFQLPSLRDLVFFQQCIHCPCIVFRA